MADTRTTTPTMDFVVAYADEDTRTIKIPNPTHTTDATNWRTKFTALAEITLSDRSKGNVAAGAYVSVASAVNRTITKIDLDLTQND